MHIKQVIIEDFKSYKEQIATESFSPKVNCVGVKSKGDYKTKLTRWFEILDLIDLKRKEFVARGNELMELKTHQEVLLRRVGEAGKLSIPRSNLDEVEAFLWLHRHVANYRSRFIRVIPEGVKSKHEYLRTKLTRFVEVLDLIDAEHEASFARKKELTKFRTRQNQLILRVDEAAEVSIPWPRVNEAQDFLWRHRHGPNYSDRFIRINPIPESVKPKGEYRTKLTRWVEILELIDVKHKAFVNRGKELTELKSCQEVLLRRVDEAGEVSIPRSKVNEVESFLWTHRHGAYYRSRFICIIPESVKSKREYLRTKLTRFVEVMDLIDAEQEASFARREQSAKLKARQNQLLRRLDEALEVFIPPSKVDEAQGLLWKHPDRSVRINPIPESVKPKGEYRTKLTRLAEVSYLINDKRKEFVSWGKVLTEVKSGQELLLRRVGNAGKVTIPLSKMDEVEAFLWKHRHVVNYQSLFVREAEATQGYQEEVLVTELMKKGINSN